MTSPLLPFQGDFDPRAFAFQNLAAERKDERLNIGKHDGSRSGLPKEGLQGLLMAFLHRYMIAKCASVSHVCWCDVMPQATGGSCSLNYGGLVMTDWILNVDRMMTRFWSARPLVGRKPLVGSEPCCPPALFGRSGPTARQGFYPWTPATAGHCSRRSHLVVGGQKRGGMVRRSAKLPMPKPPVPQVNLVAWRELARLAANTNQYQHAVNNRSAQVEVP